MRAVGVPGEWLYAIGDCTGLALFTHMGKYHGRIASDVILGKDVVDVADHDMVPRVTFTDPQVCAVGLTEAQAREKGLNIRTVTYGVGDVPGAYTSGQRDQGHVVPRRRRRSRSHRRRDVHGPVDPGAAALGDESRSSAKCRSTRLRHAVPSFPTVSEVWLHLLEEYGL